MWETHRSELPTVCYKHGYGDCVYNWPQSNTSTASQIESMAEVTYIYMYTYNAVYMKIICMYVCIMLCVHITGLTGDCTCGDIQSEGSHRISAQEL